MSAAQAATRLEAIRNSLAARAGIETDARAIAAATESAWRDVTAQLAPVIGNGGLQVLFSRAMHQTSSEFPWLAGVSHDAAAMVVPGTLATLLAGQDAASARAASSAVLMSFAKLLAALIGEPLAGSLLAPVWVLPPPRRNRSGESTMAHKVAIRRLRTGVPGLDAVLGGGLPEFSFNLIVGAPGSGKTTLAHQIMFGLATDERPALFFTVLGEPPLKMLRYQQQFAFFDLEKINKSIRYFNLSDEVSTGNFDQVLASITREVESVSPGLVFVDSFRSVTLEAQQQPRGTIGMQQFIQKLGIHLSGWEATTFLVGEYSPDNHPHPIHTVADGLFALEQSVYRNSMVRRLQVVKMRGQAVRPGMQTFRISSAGIEVFPPALVVDDTGATHPAPASASTKARLSMGVPGMDQMLGGGLPAGYSMLVAGPSGSGKTILATAFLREGVRLGQPGVIVAFEQTPSQSRTRSIDDMVRAGQIGLLNTRSLDLSIDEIVQRLLDLIHQKKATRVVIDSLSGFELAVAPSFRDDFRESLFRMVAVLAGTGVTVLMTSELEDRYTDLRFSPYGSAFLTDAIIVQRYVEIESRLNRVLAVVKVRSSAHSKELREFEITDEGIIIGRPVPGYEGLLGGHPRKMPLAAEVA